MAAIHYDAFFDEEDGCDIASCGTPVGENYEWSNNWHYVSCKKCFRSKEKYKEEIQLIIKQRAFDDEGFLEFSNIEL